MVQLDVIRSEEPNYMALEALKSFAAVSDKGQEYLLTMALKRAFAMVQRYADVALVSGQYVVKADDHNGEVRVYMGGKVDYVKDAKGADVPFEQKGNLVELHTDRYVEVTFTTNPSPADYDRLLPVVLRYATACYDGKSTSELNAILREC